MCDWVAKEECGENMEEGEDTPQPGGVGSLSTKPMEEKEEEED